MKNTQPFRHIFNLAILIFLLSVLSACRGTKSIVTSEVKENTTLKIYNQIVNNQLQYTTLAARFNISFTDANGTQQAKGNLQMVKDSAIWFSITPGLGIELIRVLLTTDSIKMINRLNSTYFCGKYDLVKKFTGASVYYDDIQAILTNNIFLYNAWADGNQIEKYETNIEENSYCLKSVSSKDWMDLTSNSYSGNKPTVQSIHVIPEVYSITSNNIFDFATSDALDINYSDFRELGDSRRVFPYKIEVIAHIKSKTNNFELEYTTIEINKKVNLQFKIPEKYKAMELR